MNIKRLMIQRVFLLGEAKRSKWAVVAIGSDGGAVFKFACNNLFQIGNNCFEGATAA